MVAGLYALWLVGALVPLLAAGTLVGNVTSLAAAVSIVAGFAFGWAWTVGSE